jgi:hypothetical protein
LCLWQVLLVSRVIEKEKEKLANIQLSLVNFNEQLLKIQAL